MEDLIPFYVTWWNIVWETLPRGLIEFPLNFHSNYLRNNYKNRFSISWDCCRNKPVISYFQNLYQLLLNNIKQVFLPIILFLLSSNYFYFYLRYTIRDNINRNVSINNFLIDISIDSKRSENEKQHLLSPSFFTW